MKKIKYIVLFTIGFMIISACGEATSSADQASSSTEDAPIDTVSFLSDLELLEGRINNSEGIPSERDLESAVTNFQDFTAIFPRDKKAPEYLLKASDFAHTLGRYEESISILENIIENYPDYNKMESVKYNRASHLDFELRDTTLAKEAYQDFMNTYPNSPLVSDCESRIENIRYSLEELTEKFIKDLESGENASTGVQ